MDSTSENNKRIAKNTIFLYIRMLVTMSVSLFTARIVLNSLGVEDYGINNVVAGVVTMFVFLNSTLASGTQRFLTFALGKNDYNRQQLTFTTTFFVHLALGIILGILIFIIGYWMLVKKLNIPPSRLEAAYYVFVCATITVVLNITQVPYLSSIIAHENMSIYAYMSIFDAVAKLMVAYALVYSTDMDKLKLYAILLLVIAIINIIIYRLYCIHKYKECHIKAMFDKELLKSILSFSGWNIIGCGASIGNNQGFNILLNIFFGPLINAARGISMQVNSLALQFVNNFQTAVNPQIVKYYANHEIDKMNRLINNNAKYAGLLMLFIVIPLSVEIEFLLHLWLGQVPEETVFFTRMVLIQSFIQTLSRPVVMGIHATGRMKWPNILAGGILLLILPISYLLLKWEISLHLIMVINIVPWLCEAFIDATLLNKYVGFPVLRYYKKVYWNTCLIGIMSLLPLILINAYMPIGWSRLIITALTSVIWMSLLIYRYGINTHIRSILKNKILNYNASI